MNILGCCVQCRSHSDGSDLGLMFVRTISSYPLNLFLPNILWCLVISQRCKGQRWAPIIKVNITVRAQIIEVWPFIIYILNCWSFCIHTKFDDASLNASQSVLWQYWSDMFKVKVTAKVQNIVKCLSNLFFATDVFATKLGVLCTITNNQTKCKVSVYWQYVLTMLLRHTVGTAFLCLSVCLSLSLSRARARRQTLFWFTVFGMYKSRWN